MRLIAISDTHNKHRSVRIPDGDVFIHAGDISNFNRSKDHYTDFNDWVGTLPHKHKLVIAGNHDERLQKNGIVEAHRLLSHCIYLEDDSIVIDGVKFHGSPWQPWFYDWAFNLRYEEQLAEKWAKIPDDTHVLITHTPPHQICDYTVRGNNIGSTSLLERVLKVQPKIHVFGHAHAPSRSGGPVGNTLFCNVADDLRIKEAMVLDLIGGEASMVTTL